VKGPGFKLIPIKFRRRQERKDKEKAKVAGMGQARKPVEGSSSNNRVMHQIEKQIMR
jgi:hypothetical protein